MLQEKLKKKHFAEKSQSVFEGFKGGPFKHTKTFFQKKNIYFSLYLWKVYLLPIQEIFDCKVFKFAAFQQSFFQCWWKRSISEGSLIKKPTQTMN